MTSAPNASPPLAGAALQLTGRDVLTVLHRTSTNALADLAQGSARPTLFCDFRGRLLHRAIVAHARDGSVWMLRDDAPGDLLAAFIDRSVFREDVRIEDRSAAMPMRLVRVPAELAPPGAVIEGGAGLSLVALEAPFALAGDAAQPGVEPVTEAGRIAAGLPRHGHEIADAFTPYEVNLAHEVHLAKGCFTGQESLQRLVTYESIRRQLARVSGQGAPPAVPADVIENGERAGVLTSAAAAERGWTGLAVLRRDRFEARTGFAFADGGPLAIDEVFAMRRPLGRP